VWVANLATGQFQALKGLGAGYLVHQMPVHKKKWGLSGFFVNQVRVPDFFVHCLAHIIPVAIPVIQRAAIQRPVVQRLQPCKKPVIIAQWVVLV
jgi:hypothetical protein